MSARPAGDRGRGLQRARLIALREFRERVGQRAYRIALLVGAIVAAAAVVLPSVLGDDGDPEPERIAIVVQGGEAGARIQALDRAAAAIPGPPIRFASVRSERAVRDAVREGDRPVGAIVTGSEAQPRLRLVTREGGSDLTTRVSEAVDRAAQERRLQAAGTGLSPATFFARTPVQGEIVEGSGPTGATTAVVSVLGLLLYLAGILLTTTYATGVVSDRSNHVTERLLTAARPSEHLAGKLVGIGASGLLQFFAWIAVALVADAVVGSGTALDDVPTMLLVFFPIALVLTYVLYASAATILVLPVRKAEDVGGAIGPAVMLQVVAFLLTSSIVTPGATVSGAIQALSLVPFFSPLLMLARLAGGDVPAWEVAVAIAGPLVLAAILLKLAAPAYARFSIDAASGKGLKAAIASLRRG